MMLSSIFIVCNSLWMYKPITEKTGMPNKVVGFLILLPNFFFRMVVWQIIFILFENFSILFLFVSYLIYCPIIYFFHEKFTDLDPLYYSLLSLILPMYRLPSVKSKQSEEHFKILFFLILSGNIFLITTFVFIFSLYINDLYNPWCRAGVDFSNIL